MVMASSPASHHRSLRLPTFVGQLSASLGASGSDERPQAPLQDTTKNSYAGLATRTL